MTRMTAHTDSTASDAVLGVAEEVGAVVFAYRAVAFTTAAAMSLLTAYFFTRSWWLFAGACLVALLDVCLRLAAHGGLNSLVGQLSVAVMSAERLEEKVRKNVAKNSD